MKIALVQPVFVPGAKAFGWKWRSEEGAAESADTFKYFHDCCESARRKGYQCRFDGESVGSGTPAALQRLSGIDSQRTSRLR